MTATFVSYGLGAQTKWLTERFWFRVGVEHVGGDMFKSVPEGDAIFMKVAFAFLALIYRLYIS